MPRPSGTTAPTQQELFLQQVQDLYANAKTWLNENLLFDVVATLNTVWGYIEPNLLWVGIVLLALALWWVVSQRVRVWEGKIRRLWAYLLFFLSKRQMLIPLIHTYATRTGYLTADQLGQLVQLRNECQQISLTRNPQQRIHHEMDLSKLLYTCFQKLETEGHLNPGEPLTKVVEDLEFIDEKLVELQAQYNQSAEKFNTRMVKNLLLRLLFWPLKLKELPLFRA